MTACQKMGMILENKVVQKLKLENNVFRTHHLWNSTTELILHTLNTYHSFSIFFLVKGGRKASNWLVMQHFLPIESDVRIPGQIHALKRLSFFSPLGHCFSALPTIWNRNLKYVQISYIFFVKTSLQLFCPRIQMSFDYVTINGVTAKRKLETLQFSTSSSFVKIWCACSCEFKAYFWTFWALYHLLFDLETIGVN